MQQKIGATIRQARISQQLLLRKAAAALDIDAGLLSKIERNERRATRKQLMRLAEFYKLNRDELLIDWLSEIIVKDLKDEVLAEKVLQAVEQKLHD